MSRTASPCLVGGFIDHVESAEALWVGVFDVFEFVFEEDVGFGEVAEDESDFCFVFGVFEDGADELIHSIFGLGSNSSVKGDDGDVLRCDASPASNQCDMFMLVRRPGELRDRSFEVQPLTRLHTMQMLAHRPIWIPLSIQLNMLFEILIACRRIWPTSLRQNQGIHVRLHHW